MLSSDSWPLRVAAAAACLAVAVCIHRFRRLGASRVVQRVLLEAVSIVLVIGGMSLVFYLRSGAPPVKTVRYAAMINFRQQHWYIEHSIALLNRDWSDFGDNKVESYEHIRSNLQMCGWKEEAELHFSLKATQDYTAPWFPLKTLNAIAFPPMRCNGLILVSTGDSIATVNAPKYLIFRTAPQPKSRVDALSGASEKIEVPIAFSWNETPSLEMEVISPLLRNIVGAWLLRGAAWEPIKWIVLALCSIFSEQIKKSILMPLAKKVFKILHLPFKEQEAAVPAEQDERRIIVVRD